MRGGKPSSKLSQMKALNPVLYATGAVRKATSSVPGTASSPPATHACMNPSRAMAEESRAESPMLRTPRPGIDLVCVAGADERPEFIRQNAILPLAWQVLGASCHSQLLAGHNHFTVIETMTRSDSRLCELVDGPLA